MGSSGLGPLQGDAVIWDRIVDLFRAAHPLSEDAGARLARAGELASAEMERLWKLDIIDPKIGAKGPLVEHSLAEINRIIVRNGWGRPGEYKGNGPPQWCGMTAGDAWATAGLDPASLRVFWASTDRLIAWARYESFNGHRNVPRPKSGARGCVKLERGKAPAVLPRPGDVVLVGTGKRPAGDHVTVNMGYDAATRTFDTISGNGGGKGPHGDKREGISRRDYKIDPVAGERYHAMWLVRPGAGDVGA